MFECRHRPLALPDPLVSELAAAYCEPHRAYHNLTHIADLLAWFDTLTWSQPAEVYVAILFHDAVYVPSAKDNEAHSAAWVRRSGLPVDLETVAHLIELTAAHGRLDHADGDAALFLDCDMAIVGAAPEAYRRYAAAIRQEYAAIPDAAYRTGRTAFLRSVAAKPRIFFTDYFHARLDAQARANIYAELEELA